MDTLRALRVLGLPPGASPEEIKNAWRDLAKVWHPDRFAHDERLRHKAGDNLQRINEAHEALRDYDPASTPRLAARMRESVAIILGMGELGEPPPLPAPPPGTPAGAAREAPLQPTAPIGARHSLRVLGLGIRRSVGEVGTRRRSSRGWLVALLIVIVFALAVASLLQSQQADAAGRAIVDEINRVRADPSGYAAALENALPLYVGNELRRPGQITIRTNEGAAAVREAIAALRSQSPLPPLTFSDGLARAAADHVRDQGPSGATGHDGSDGSTMRTRIERYGRWDGGISENIDYGSAAAGDVVMSLVVDDGVASRGHRRNILDPAIRYAGAACGPHRQYRTMCVIDHAGAFTPREATPVRKPARTPPSGLPHPR